MCIRDRVTLNGLPAALFAVLAGVTLMLISRDFTATTFLRIIARGCIITLIGLALLPVGGEIQIVLVVIGITMILVSWVPPLRWWWKLLLLAAATAAAVKSRRTVKQVDHEDLRRWIVALALGK